MNAMVHKFSITLDWDMIESLSKIDRFDSSWSFIEKKEGLSLNQLKSLASLRSTGASTRMEGSRLSDEQVDKLLRNRNRSRAGDRDSQELVGYFETLNLISEMYEGMDISEDNLKYLHNLILRYSKRDQWHKGDFKQHSNTVEAFLADGTKRVVFQTAEPGLATEDAMRDLIKWYNTDDKIHPLIKCATFIYGFVRIHPFQDGNGRMSRLISNLLLMKHGYKWIQYISFEHEIEIRKVQYNQELRKYPVQQEGEDICSWLNFFFDALISIQQQLLQKIQTEGTESQLSPRERSILVMIGDSPGCRSGEIAEKSGIPNPTIKRLLSDLYSKNLIERYGSGPGTNYSIK